MTEKIKALIAQLTSPALKHAVFNVLNPIKDITAKFTNKDSIFNFI